MYILDITYLNGTPHTYEIGMRCRYCKVMIKADVYVVDWDIWQGGAYAQAAFPYLKDNIRRSLFITKLCENCNNIIEKCNHEL